MFTGHLHSFLFALQVHSITEKLQSKSLTNAGGADAPTSRPGFLRIDDQFQQAPTRSNYDSHIANESDRQELLLREQDEGLDDLSASLTHVGHVGVSIHEELSLQGQLMEKFSEDTDGTASRLDVVQKKLATVMKMAGWKGQVFMIVFLVVLLVILIFLVFSG